MEKDENEPKVYEDKKGIPSWFYKFITNDFAHCNQRIAKIEGMVIALVTMILAFLGLILSGKVSI